MSITKTKKKYKFGEKLYYVFLDLDIGAWNYHEFTLSHICIKIDPDKEVIYCCSSEFEDEIEIEENDVFCTAYDAANECKNRNKK